MGQAPKMLAYRVEASGCLYPYTLLLTLLEALDPDRPAPLLVRGKKCLLHEDAAGQKLKVQFPSGEGSKSKYDLTCSSDSTHAKAGDSPAVGAPLIDVIELRWGQSRTQTLLYAKSPAAVDYIETLTEILRADRRLDTPGIGAILHRSEGKDDGAAYMDIMLSSTAARVMFLLANHWDPLRPGSCYGPSPTRLKKVTAYQLVAIPASIPSPLYTESPFGHTGVLITGSGEARAALLRDADKCGFIERIPDSTEPLTLAIKDVRQFVVIADIHGCDVKLIPNTWNTTVQSQKWHPVEVHSSRKVAEASRV
jgi:hypothetical protein